MKEHDRTTTKRIQDNRLRVSLLKNTKILIPVHILSQEVFPQLLQVSHHRPAVDKGGLKAKKRESQLLETHSFPFSPFSFHIQKGHPLKMSFSIKVAMTYSPTNVCSTIGPL